tara:strand:- start:5668 stop:5826 length:159 start_codon:yes stop_codon:yes gene_type:complete
MKNLFLILITTLFSFGAFAGNVGGGAALKPDGNIKSSLDVFLPGKDGNVGGN